MTLLWIVVYLGLCVLVGLWAQKLMRNGTPYMIFSVIFSPLIIAIILAFLGENKKAIKAEIEEARRRKIEKENRIQEIKQNITASWKNILEQNGFAEYIEIFEKNKINNADVILTLNEQDLESMGISAVGDRKRIIQIFKESSPDKK
jgi:predicted Ser/Thr protein kinase